VPGTAIWVQNYYLVTQLIPEYLGSRQYSLEKSGKREFDVIWKVVIFGSDTAGKQLVYIGIITDAGANKKILLYVVERMCNSDYAVVLVFCIFLLYSLL